MLSLPIYYWHVRFSKNVSLKPFNSCRKHDPLFSIEFQCSNGVNIKDDKDDRRIVSSTCVVIQTRSTRRFSDRYTNSGTAGTAVTTRILYFEYSTLLLTTTVVTRRERRNSRFGLFRPARARDQAPLSCHNNVLCSFFFFSPSLSV